MRMGLVSNKAVQRVRGVVTHDYTTTGTGPRGAVGRGAIDDQNSAKPRGNLKQPAADWGPHDAGQIDADANCPARQWGKSVEGQGPPCAEVDAALVPTISPASSGQRVRHTASSCCERWRAA